ncbi:MAG TPA: hypothetical protein VFM86_13205 [Pedococcus sp.]|nr:hypothetical protein [Pedococcus sp.]
MSTTRAIRTVTAAVAGVVALGVVAVVASSHHAGAAQTTRAGTLRVVAAAGEVAAPKPTKDAPWAAADGIRALAPGELRTVEVTVTNPGTTAYRVLELTATPRDTGTDCRADRSLVVSSYRSDRTGAPTYVVPRGSSIRIPVTVMRLALPGQDSCRDATFPLTLTGVVSPGRAATNAG